MPESMLLTRGSHGVPSLRYECSTGGEGEAVGEGEGEGEGEEEGEGEGEGEGDGDSGMGGRSCSSKSVTRPSQ